MRPTLHVQLVAPIWLDHGLEVPPLIIARLDNVTLSAAAVARDFDRHGRSGPAKLGDRKA